MSRELLKLVIAECSDEGSRSNITTALYCKIAEYLEMPEPEPVAYCYAWIDEDGDEVNRLGFTVPSEGFDAIPLYTSTPDQSARIAEYLEMPEPEPVASINGWYGGYPTIRIINGAVLPAGMALYKTPPDQSARIAELEKDNNITHENLAWYMAKYYEHLTIIAELEQQLEIERMRLVGCGVAALSNTDESVKARINSLSPFWSASYGDVCAAVDREMALRQQLAALQAKREPLSDAEIQHIADKHLCAAAQFIGAGELWIDGTENFARAIEAAHGIGVNHE